MSSNDRVDIASILKGTIPIGAAVTVRGWVRTRRDSKAGLSFIHVHDGSCFDPLQVVAPADLPNYESEIRKLTSGCSVIATGTLTASQGQAQAVEVQAAVGRGRRLGRRPGHVSDSAEEDLVRVSARGRASAAADEHDRRHRPRAACAQHGDSPLLPRARILLGAHADHHGERCGRRRRDVPRQHARHRQSRCACRGTPDGRTDFTQDFFGKEAFLTVSGQLNVETYCCALSKVYTFGPTFRAENSNTSRHLAEFWMVEPEIAFADLNDNADLAESFLKYIFTALLTERGDDLKFFADRIDKDCIARLERFVNSSFERMTYTEAIAALEKSGKKFEFPVHWGIDLQSEHERWLTEEHVKAPVVVMNYPKEIKAFYMRMNDDGKTVAAMDVLAPGIGEIIGGSQREERLDALDRRLAEMNLDAKHYAWYRDLRRYGTVPHAGFGLGLERTIIYATGMANIRDVIPFPRTPGHAAF